MSGHSKWATIKRKKAVVDARRGQAWTKHAKAITMAAKLGGGSVDDNARLRLAVDKAKASNMPKDTIEKAILKGTGGLDGDTLEEVVYEGYGPGGVAIMAKATTDNRTRTAPEIKTIFSKGGGNLGAVNCVSWMFTQQGVIIVSAEKMPPDRVLEIALDNGADDVKSTDDEHEVVCSPDAFLPLRDALEKAGCVVLSADLTMVAANEVTLDAEQAVKVLKLIDTLEEHDDVDDVYSNASIADEIMAKLG